MLKRLAAFLGIGCLLFFLFGTPQGKTFLEWLSEPESRPLSEEEIQKAKVLYLIDGDTLQLSIDGESVRVRLLGIDAPESVHRDESKNTSFGVSASAHLSGLVSEDQIVYLTKLPNVDTDLYGRLLRYVWTERPEDALSEAELLEKCLNARMLADGYAETNSFGDDGCAALFDRFQREAEEKKAGLWAEEAWYDYLRRKEYGV